MQVKDLYRAFKGDCPTGIIDEAKFKEVLIRVFCRQLVTQDWWERRAGCWFVFPSQVYQSLFPLGESAKYAHLVFKSIDRDNTGCLKFESEFQLSSLHHKCLYWTIKKWGPTMMKILIMQVYGVTSKYPQEGLHLETSWTFSPFSAKDLREIRWQMFLSFSKRICCAKFLDRLGLVLAQKGESLDRGSSWFCCHHDKAAKLFFLNNH